MDTDCEYAGNNPADRLDKDAACPSETHPFRTRTKALVRSKISTQCEQQGKSTTKCTYLRSIDNTLLAVYTRRLYGSLPRTRVYLLTQMRTGHNWLSTYTKVHRFRDDDHCASGVQEKKFTSKVTPGLPQSELDKVIFFPDWKLRPKWG
ncbi:hypothetical protein DTO013F2_8411 [Penicillium roqueforti]|nr:hypothetical protein DTO013F2_8411 [Penicillium roqueforti]